MESRKSKDSYLQRRKLFKNIWDAAAQMEDENEPENVMNSTKPKVIKTLRLSEEGPNIGIKIKKQRIKNLRTVCTRLLDICNKQETDDILYDQISAARNDPTLTSKMFAHRRKLKKRPKKKIKKTYGTPPINNVEDRVSFGVDTDGPITHRGTKPLRQMLPSSIDRATLIKQFVNERYKLQKTSHEPDPVESEHNDLGDTHRRVVKKKQKRKISSTSKPRPRLSSTTKRVST